MKAFLRIPAFQKTTFNISKSRYFFAVVIKVALESDKKYYDQFVNLKSTFKLKRDVQNLERL